MNTREKTTEELLRMGDGEIDFSDIPELEEDFFQNAYLVFPVEDRDILIRYKKHDGKDYRARMHAVLREHIDRAV